MYRFGAQNGLDHGTGLRAASGAIDAAARIPQVHFIENVQEVGAEL